MVALEDESDDSYKKFDVVDANNKVISNSVFSFAEDHDWKHLGRY